MTREIKITMLDEHGQTDACLNSDGVTVGDILISAATLMGSALEKMHANDCTVEQYKRVMDSLWNQVHDLYTAGNAMNRREGLTKKDDEHDDAKNYN